MARQVGVANWADGDPVQYACYIATRAHYDSKRTLDDLIGKLPDYSPLAHEYAVAPHWVFRRNPHWWETAVCYRDDELAIVLSALPHRPFRIALPDGGMIGNEKGEKCFRYLRSAIELAEQLFPFDEPLPVLEPHHSAFRLVADPKDWKAPIDAHLSTAHDLRAVIDAIAAYTGSDVTVQPEPGGYHLIAGGARWTRNFEGPVEWLSRQLVR